jgi:hypothetical protein
MTTSAGDLAMILMVSGLGACEDELGSVVTPEERLRGVLSVWFSRLGRGMRVFAA